MAGLGSQAMHWVLAPFQQGPWWRGQGAGSVSGTSQEPSSRRCVARHRPAAGQVHCLRRLWQELVLEKTSRAGSVGPVPWCGYAVPRWAALSYIAVMWFWYESSRGNKVLLLHNLMGICLTKCWAWFIKAALCAASYWVSLYNRSCNNLADKGITCVCIDFISDFLQPTIALQTNTWLDISAIPG